LSEAARTNQRRWSFEDRPTAIVAGFYGLAQQPADRGTAARGATGSGADSRSPTHHRKSFGARLNGAQDETFPDLVAQADRLVSVEHGLRPRISLVVTKIGHRSILLPHDQRRGQRWWERDFRYVFKPGLDEPFFHFIERVTAARMGS
jgi:hypothetical protein